MFVIQDLAVRYGARTLFEQATLSFNAPGCYGIVGANGAGKSTLLRVIAGTEEPTDGDVGIPKDRRVGVLSQDHFQYDDVPILDVVMMGVPQLWGAMQEKEQILQRAAVEPTSFDVERFGDLEEIVMAHDGYAFEALAADILEGLNIPASVHREPLSTLSGGYKLRVLLAQTLASKPDILLLDEPTNHLDIVSIAWLERFLSDTFRGCAVVVSHDHRFLDTICTHIVDVDYQRVTLYRGNYTQFTEAKGAERERKEAEIAKRQAEIEGHKEFVRRFRAKATKARQAQSRIKQIERIEIEELPASSRRYPTFRIEPERDTGRQVASVEHLSKSYGDKRVLHDVSFTVARGDRVAIIGPNGVGKSTLLKIMMGEVAPDHGEVEWGHAVRTGYFSQDHAELHGCDENTIHDWLWAFCADQPTGFVRGKLAEVLFGKDEIDKKVGALSGGEMARLSFARIAIDQPTTLVLDEPTNHLDLEGIEALCEGILAYPNAVLFVSHDRWFVERVATRILEISPEGLHDFRGGWVDYLRWVSERAEDGATPDGIKGMLR